MEFKNNKRILIFSMITLLLFGVLIVQLARLTLAQGNTLVNKSETLTKRTLSVTGARGTIMDQNGIPLAYDVKCYNVQFVKDPARTTAENRANYTDILMRAIDCIEKNGGKVINNFSIVRDAKTGIFKFDFKTSLATAAAKREDRWRKDMYVTDKTLYPTPESIYNYLRVKYQIPEELSYDQAQKLLSIWQEVQLNAGKMYEPITIASDVNIATVAQLETYSNELDGIRISEGTTRIYPRASTAAHIIGYLGKIDVDNIDKMTKKGYQPSDLIGVSGIEKTMEDQLTCDTKEKLGQKEVEISRNGKIQRQLSSTPPKSGNSVMLTIDLKLQQALETVLAKNIVKIRAAQYDVYNKNRADYDEKVKARGGKQIQMAQSGAAVVLDVNTGKVLAQASYPSYDLNLFHDGSILDADYTKLHDDPAKPLFNKAVSSKATPGSVFKMCTGLAGLMEGSITLESRIDDGGYFRKYVKYGKAPSCWVRPYFGQHKNQTIIDGLKNSCNYFFFTVADRLGIDKLDKWAEKLGLTSKTGIELPGELAGQVGNQKVLYDSSKPIDKQATSLPYLVEIQIKNLLKGYGKTRNIVYTDAELTAAAEAIIKIADSDQNGTVGPPIRKVLREKLQISEAASTGNHWDTQLASSLSQIIWDPNMTIQSGIGQGVTAVTPLEIARYVAAIVNGGTVYNIHIVDKILSPEGKIISEQKPDVKDKLDAPQLQAYLNAIKKGMEKVVSKEDKGTAASEFTNYKYVDDIGGKTGTAQVSKIDIENNSWFVGFAPRDKPQIVVVSFVPHGYKGAMSSLVAKDIIKYYLDNQKRKAIDDIPNANSVVGQLFENKPDSKTSTDKSDSKKTGNTDKKNNN